MSDMEAAKKPEMGSRIGSIDTIFVCVDKNDVSERAYQLERGGTWDKGKGCDTFAPLGPWLVTRDEILDPQNLELWLEVDGKSCQNGNTSKMIFGVAHLVSYISQFLCWFRRVTLGSMTALVALELQGSPSV